MSKKNISFEDNKDVNIFSEFFSFLKENKLWWMIPIAIVLMIFIAIIAIGSQSGAASVFLYPF